MFAHSIGAALDSIFRNTNPMQLWGTAIILGFLLLLCSAFVGINLIEVPLVGDIEALARDEGKQVGMWFSPNWSVVYILLFPVFLFCLSSLSESVRTLVQEVGSGYAATDTMGRQARADDLLARLGHELDGNESMFRLLIAAVLVVTFGGWGFACAMPLLHLDIGKSVYDWATAVLATMDSDDTPPYGVIAYTLLAYVWMGFALFSYLSCLFLGFIYASYFSRLTVDTEYRTARIRPVRLLLGEGLLESGLFQLTGVYYWACVFGLFAGYFMRLQAAYLDAPETEIVGFMFRDLSHLLGAASVEGQHVAFLQKGGENWTHFLSAMVTLATLVALLGTTWNFYSTFYRAKRFTTGMLEHPVWGKRPPFADLSNQQRDQVMGRTFFRDIFPAPVPAVLIVMSIIMATVLPSYGATFLVVLTLSTVAYFWQTSRARSRVARWR